MAMHRADKRDSRQESLHGAGSSADRRDDLNNAGGGAPSGASSAGSFADSEVVRRRKKRTNRTALKVVLAVVIVILVLCAGIGISVALYFNSLNGQIAIDGDERDELDKSLVEATGNEPYYTLLLGSDARENDTTSRSDTIILARVDPAKARVTLVSIPRDTKVEIPGHGTQKINAAYAFGGASLAVDVVSDFAGVDISHYVEIHFDELEQLVDDLGGVWVDVPVSNNQTGSSNTGTSIRAGEQLMDGATALAFARERYGYTEGDFQRAENQRLVVQAIASKVMTLPPMEIPGTVQSLASSISTDYDLAELVSLAQTFQDAYPYVSFYSCMTPSTTQTIGGVSYTITLEDEWAEMMALVDAGEDPSAAAVETEGTKVAQGAEGGSGR